MQQSSIFAPFLGMMVLTFLVWIYLYVRRLGYLIGNKIPAAQVNTPEKLNQLIPIERSYPAHNFKNLFELPVLFYALCIYLYVTQTVDAVHLYAAYGFFAFRVMHSLVHCTVNIVPLRFLVYLAGALCLWLMVLRALLAFNW